jgi:hypothetical protein
VGTRSFNRLCMALQLSQPFKISGGIQQEGLFAKQQRIRLKECLAPSYLDTDRTGSHWELCRSEEESLTLGAYY